MNDPQRTPYELRLWLVVSTFLLGLVSSSALAQNCPQENLNLGTAQNFAILAGNTVTNTGTTTIVGDIGISPGSSLTGYGTVIHTGVLHLADPVSAQAQSDLTSAYNNLAGLPVDADLSGQDLGGMVLPPGVYRFSSSAQLTGTLTLDTLGDPNARFVFQIGTTLTTSSISAVNVIGGDYGGVFWQVGSSATLGIGTMFTGNILAFSSITLNTGATIACGRALARNAAVTLDSNQIQSCGGSSICTPIVVHDCNRNRIEDAEDIASSTSLDMNSNLVPDECEICTPEDIDLDGDGIPDCNKVCFGFCDDFDRLFDEDLDGVPDCDEIEDGTDPCDPGSFISKLLASSCAGANGFLEATNIATVINLAERELGVSATYRDLEGILRGQVQFVLPPYMKRDLMVNDMGLLPDTYGTVCIETTALVPGEWIGGVTQYKERIPRANASELALGENVFDFALYYPFVNATPGSSSVSINVNSLGTPLAGTNANWIRITDAKPEDGLGLKGTIFYYDLLGSLVANQDVNLPDGGRFDYAGHEALGAGGIGMAEFVPASKIAPYYFETTRYFYEGIGASDANFYSAFVMPRPFAKSTALAGQIARKANQVSIVELVNPNSDAINATVSFYGLNGSLNTENTPFLPAKGANHLIINNTQVASNTTGAVEATESSNSLFASTIVYEFDIDAVLALAFGTSLTAPGRRVQVTEFNSFIEHKNELSLSNATDSNISVDVTVRNDVNDVILDFVVSLSARESKTIPLTVPIDTYGSVVLDSGIAQTLVASNSVIRAGEYRLQFPAR